MISTEDIRDIAVKHQSEIMRTFDKISKALEGEREFDIVFACMFLISRMPEPRLTDEQTAELICAVMNYLKGFVAQTMVAVPESELNPSKVN